MNENTAKNTATNEKYFDSVIWIVYIVDFTMGIYY